MSIDVDYAALREGAKQVDKAATWVESGVETHTRGMATLGDHLAGSVAAGEVAELSRQLKEVGADLMPALQGFAQALELVATRFEQLDRQAGRAAGGT
jgi:uncharacterized protein YukE